MKKPAHQPKERVRLPYKHPNRSSPLPYAGITHHRFKGFRTNVQSQPSRLP